MAKRATIFNVTGRGKFPYDMLRYDRCYPFGPEDVAAMCGDDPRGDRTIKLECPSGMMTPARWLSFGWSCEVVK